MRKQLGSSVLALLFSSLICLLTSSPIYSQNSDDPFEKISVSNLDRLAPLISWQPDGQLLSKGISITPAKDANIALIENRLQNLLGAINLDQQILYPKYYFNTDTAINRTAISPDGQFAAVQDYTSFDVWAIATGKTVIHHQVLEADSEVNDLIFSAKSDKFAYVVSSYPNASLEDGIYIYDLSTGTQTKKLEQATAQKAIFSIDGDHLASAGYDGSLRLWDLKTDQSIPIRQSDGKSTIQLDFVSPELIAVALLDEKGHYLEYWNVQTQQPLALSKEYQSSDYRNDGISQIRLSDRVSFQLWSIFKKQDLGRFNNVGVIENINSKNNIVITSGINFFHLETGQLLRTIPIPDIYAASFSFDNQYVIFSGGDGYIQIWAVPKN